MSTRQKVSKKQDKPATKAARTATKSNSTSNSQSILLFDKTNYMLMAGGFLVVIIGFLLMVGGNSGDPNVFNADELYSFRRITLAPIVVMLGFGIEIFAIMRKPASAA